MSGRTKQDKPEQEPQAQPQAQADQPQRRLDEAPESGAVYVVNGKQVDPNGKPVDGK